MEVLFHFTFHRSVEELKMFVTQVGMRLFKRFLENLQTTYVEGHLSCFYVQPHMSGAGATKIVVPAADVDVAQHLDSCFSKLADQTKRAVLLWEPPWYRNTGQSCAFF